MTTLIEKNFTRLLINRDLITYLFVHSYSQLEPEPFAYIRDNLKLSALYDNMITYHYQDLFIRFIIIFDKQDLNYLMEKSQDHLFEDKNNYENILEVIINIDRDSSVACTYRSRIYQFNNTSGNSKELTNYNLTIIQCGLNPDNMNPIYQLLSLILDPAYSIEDKKNYLYIKYNFENNQRFIKAINTLAFPYS